MHTKKFSVGERVCSQHQLNAKGTVASVAEDYPTWGSYWIRWDKEYYFADRPFKNWELLPLTPLEMLAAQAE